MKLWMSGEIHISVADTYRTARNEIEDAFNEELGPKDYGLAKLAYLAIMRPSEWGEGAYPEVKRWKKRQREAEFRLKIPPEVFAVASALRQRGLIVESLLRAVELLEEIAPRQTKTAQLREDLVGLAQRRGWALV